MRLRATIDAIRMPFACAWAGLVAAVFLSAPAWADAEQDYREGRRAYFSGDVTGAANLLERSADAGHASAQSLFAHLLRRTERLDLAMRYFRLAAEQGNAEAQYELASMYAAGEGIEANPLEARRWMDRAAQGGHRSAILGMADAYLNGGLGVGEEDRARPEARAWIERAAALGHAPALERLSRAYREGEWGLAVDAKQAEALAAKARAVRGLPPDKRSGRGAER